MKSGVANDKSVIFYLVDGARPDVLTRLINDNTLPNIRKYLYEEGSYTKGTSCIPSTTGPAYLPFLTGQFPGDHHITGIRWFDKKEYFDKSRWTRNAMRSYCGYEAKYFNDDLDPRMPSLFEEVDKGFNIYNMITKGVKEENDVTKKGKSGLYFKAHFYHKHHEVDELGHLRLMECLDKDPQFIFAVFPSVDWDSHTYHYEDEKTIEAYKIADKSLGEVVNKLKAKGTYEDTLILMVSDHGLSATTHHLDLGKFFKHNGYRVLEYPTIFSIKPNVAVLISGNSYGSISFLDHKEEYYKAELESNHGPVIQNLVNQSAIDFIVYRADENSLVVRNKTGEALIRIGTEHRLSYHIDTADPLELEHNLDNLDSEEAFDATFNSNYPDSLFQLHRLMKSHRAGDVAVFAAVGYDLRDFWEIPEHKGSHGSLHWEHMHVPILTNKKDHINQPVRTAALHGKMKEWLGLE